MTDAQKFMIAAAKVNDPELASMMREALLGEPTVERLHWIRQVELALDGYGGERHHSATERIANILRDLEIELQGNASLTAA